jgi:hypothetical protein
MTSSVYLARLDVRTTVSPDGQLRWVCTTNKSWGPNDVPGGREVREVREGRLTPAQANELARLFDGWGPLSEQYGGVPDGPEISVRYGDKKVAGGSMLPQRIRDIEVRLTELAMTMPRIE